MEFRYRAGETSSAQNSTPAPAALPAAPVTSVNLPLLQGGIPLATNGSDFLRWREIEKQRIRQEILAAERQELEDEVRRELEMERAISFLLQSRGFASQPWPLVATPKLNPTHQVVTPPATEDQVFVLDKTDLQVCGDKRKPETADVSAPSGLEKKLKQ